VPPVELLEDAAEHETQAALTVGHASQGCVLRLVLEYALQAHQNASFQLQPIMSLCDVNCDCDANCGLVVSSWLQNGDVLCFLWGTN
jgi:hypothetical protein